jgi:hypothetical protein
MKIASCGCLLYWLEHPLSIDVHSVGSKGAGHQPQRRSFCSKAQKYDSGNAWTHLEHIALSLTPLNPARHRGALAPS